MNKDIFVPLHLHSLYSLMDGVIRLEKLAKYCKELGLPACAISDHGTLAGVIEFYKAMKGVGVKPILGIEAYCTEDPDDLSKEQMTRDNRHIVLLAMNSIGFRNLIWMNNRAHLRNFYYRPRIWKGHFKTHNEGIICLSGCLSGIIAKRTIYNQRTGEVLQEGSIFTENKEFIDIYETGERWAKEISQYFPERFHIEIQDHPAWEPTALNKWAIQLADKLDLPLILTTDAHYLREEDKSTHQLIMAQQWKKPLQEAKESYGDIELWVKSPEEMYKAARRWEVPEAFWNSQRIAEQCEVEISLGKYELPFFDIKKAPDYEDFLKERRC